MTQRMGYEGHRMVLDGRGDVNRIGTEPAVQAGLAVVMSFTSRNEGGHGA